MNARRRAARRGESRAGGGSGGSTWEAAGGREGRREKSARKEERWHGGTRRFCCALVLGCSRALKVLVCLFRTGLRPCHGLLPCPRPSFRVHGRGAGWKSAGLSRAVKGKRAVGGLLLEPFFLSLHGLLAVVYRIRHFFPHLWVSVRPSSRACALVCYVLFNGCMRALPLSSMVMYAERDSMKSLF